MIRVTIELFPHGLDKNKQTLGICEIWNKCTGTNTRGNYGFRFFKKGTKTIWKSGDIESFPREKLLSWDLLYRILKTTIGERNE